MGETTRSLILTALPYTTSSFRRRNPHFVPIYMKPATTAAATTYLDFYCLPSAVTPAGFGSSGCFALRRKSSPVTAFGQSQQMGGNGSKGTKGFSWAQPILRFAGNNVLPLALVAAVALGLAYPSPGCAADKYNLSKLGPFGIFVISGLMLRGEEISAAVEAWPVGLFGLVSILFLSPYLSQIIMQIQLQPQEFITGLAIFSCMPTTLSSGVALTQLAGGNSALALAMTVISNMLGILIVPFSIKKFVADGVGMNFPTKQLFKSLVLTILIPLIMGKVLRESFKVGGCIYLVVYVYGIVITCNDDVTTRLGNIIGMNMKPQHFFHTLALYFLLSLNVVVFITQNVADFVDQNRKLFAGISALFLGLVPWTQVSRSRSLLLMVKPTVFLVAIGLGTLLHLNLLIFNSIAVWSLSAISGSRKSAFSREENASALILVASQKTLPVVVAVIQPLGSAFGEPGLLVLPCVAAHLNQIILDSFLVNFLRPKDHSKFQ